MALPNDTPAPVDCFCHPRVLADFFVNANGADALLEGTAASLQSAYEAFFAASSDFVPYLGTPHNLIRSLKAEDEALNAFAMDVANAFVTAGGNGQSLDTMGADVTLGANSAAVTSLVPQMAAVRTQALEDRAAIQRALDSGDRDALRDALSAARAHSQDGTFDVYSATLVVLMGTPMIDRVLDSVRFRDPGDGSGVPHPDDLRDIAAPMAILLQSASRSGNPQAQDIAWSYITDAAAAKRRERDNGISPYYQYEPPEARRRLGLLLSAGSGDAQWTAEAADVMLLSDRLMNSQETAYFNRVALQALDTNDEAAHLFLTGGDFMTSSQDERVRELLNADWNFSHYPGAMDQGFTTTEFAAQRRDFNDLAGKVLESGLVAYPERNGDPFAMHPPSDEAVRAAATYHDIIGIVGNGDAANPFHEGAVDDPLRLSLARVGAPTWMMDAIGRDVAAPGGPVTAETLDKFYRELIQDGQARETLQLGAVTYSHVSITEVVDAANPDVMAASLARGPDGKLLPGASGVVPIPTASLEMVDGSAAQTGALAWAINGGELSAKAGQSDVATWTRTLAQTGVSVVGATVPGAGVPLGILSPVTLGGLQSAMQGPPAAGHGGTFAEGANQGVLSTARAAIDLDPRYAQLGTKDRDTVAWAMAESYEDALSDIWVTGAMHSPGSN